MKIKSEKEGIRMGEESRKSSEEERKIIVKKVSSIS